MRRSIPLLFVACAALPAVIDIQIGSADDPPMVRDALLKATTFFDQHVSNSGGYLWKYSSDLTRREGERATGPTTAWVQPPGTPTIGEAFLACYQQTGEPRLLQAAKRTAHALAAGQLESGGWDYRIEFASQDRLAYRYRRGVPSTSTTATPREPTKSDASRSSKARNVSTLDDNTTQAALQFLMKMDQELKFSDPVIHDAAIYALRQLIAVQYPNGAWPQRFSGPATAPANPAAKAKYPADWPRTYPKRDYRGDYTFNDNSIADVIRTMFMAHEIYAEAKYRQAAIKGGEFILRAQMPEPQPGWAQQYNQQMEPSWARRFEPPAVTGGESQRIMLTLLDIYNQTGDTRFLTPIPIALRYYRNSLRPDGRLARFYELKTNKPLYFTKAYELTYSDRDMPTHYGFIVSSKLDVIERRYQQLKTSGPTKPLLAARPTPTQPTRKQVARAQAIAEQLDARGAWVTLSKLADAPAPVACIESAVFARNLRVLAEGVAPRPQSR